MFKENSKKYLIFGLIGLAVVGLGLVLAFSENTSAIPNSSGKQLKNLVNADLIGKPAMTLDLFDKNGQRFDLDSLKGKKTVLFFSEGLGCYPACWNQMIALGQDERFNNQEITSYSVIADTAADLAKSQAKNSDLEKARVLFDPAGTSSRKTGLLKVASSMHKGLIPGHTYLLIDKDGIIKKIYDDPFMAINNDKIWESLANL